MEKVLEHRCYRRTYAGAILGSVMGFFAGVTNSVSTLGMSNLKLFLKDSAVARNAMRQTGVSIVLLGAWSGLFQGFRCLAEERRIDDPTNVLAAFSGSIAPFLPLSAFRRQMPWAIALTALDVYHHPK